MCLYNGFLSMSVPEVEFKNDEKTKKMCENCKYSNWC